MSTSSSQMIGRTILNYKIISSIGKGGMGEVFLANDETIERKVAIKTLLFSANSSEVVSQRFKNEASTLSRLSHSNIVSFLHFHEDDLGLYLILEYVEGVQLNDFIAENKGPVEEKLAVDLMLQLLSATKHIHKRGFIHRDIKPSNIIVTSDNTIKVIDFGISKKEAIDPTVTIDDSSNTKTNHDLTKEGAQIGTILFMSPEQIAGNDADIRSDVYALGVTFYQMLTGKNPYSGISSIYSISDKIVREPLGNPHDLNLTISDFLCDAIKKATQKEPAKRFQSCEEFIIAISPKRDDRTPSNWLKISKIAAIALLLIASLFMIIRYVDISSMFKSDKITLMPVKIGGEYAYVDREGKMVINPLFTSAHLFNDGLALVSTGDSENLKYGFINEKGEFVIEPQYLEATSFVDGLAWVVKKDGKPMAINTKGEVKITTDALITCVFHEGLAAYCTRSPDGTDAFWGFMDKEGNPIIKPQYRNVSLFNDGVACAQLIVSEEADSITKVNCWILIDKTGKPTCSQKFEKLQYVSNGLSVASKGGKIGAIDTRGNFIINPQYDKLKQDDELFIFQQNGKFGWLDSKGEVIIKADFPNVGAFGKSDLAPALSGSKWGFIDKEGTFVINPTFDSVYVFDGDLAPVWKDGKMGFIDEKGEYAVSPQFDAISADYPSFLRYSLPFKRVVQSDYFDADALVEQLNFESPLGFNVFTTTYGDFLEQKGMKKSDFKDTETDIIKNVPMAADVTYSFSVQGAPFTMSLDREYDNWGGYTYKYKSAFDATASPIFYVYKIKFGFINKEKEELFLKSLDKKLQDDGFREKSEDFYENDKEFVFFGEFNTLRNSNNRELEIKFRSL